MLPGTKQVYSENGTLVIITHCGRWTRVLTNPSSIEEEAYAVHEFKSIPLKQVSAQVKTYHSEGFTNQVELPASSVLLRRHSLDVMLFNQDWWREVREVCPRDQMSMGYAAWKNKLTVGWLPGDWRLNRFTYRDYHIGEEI